MNHPNEQVILEKLKRLPPERVAEVEDFVDFLCAHSDGRALTRDATRAALPAFAQVWDNEEDAAYDAL